MNCLCIVDNNFLFAITLKQDYFIFTDYSNWGENFEKNISQESLNQKVDLKIKIDNYFAQVQIYPGQANILSYDLLPDTECGKDGIYEFEITACSNTQILSIHYPILKNIECAYNNLILKRDWDNAQELNKYIEFIKANAYYNDFDLAKEYINIAFKFIKKLNCNC